MSAFVLDNAELWIGDGTWQSGHVAVEAGRITTIAPGRYDGDLPRTDLAGLALSPGMIDLMVLGGFGLTLHADDPAEIARRYVRLGVTACQFCCGTRPWELMQALGGRIRDAQTANDSDAAAILGHYWEGPFQHPATTGASRPEHALPPTPEHVERLLAEFDDITTMVNVSPGTEGDAQAVARLVGAGKTVTMAHSDAPAERVLACVEAGTRVCGHCWNNHQGALAEPGVQRATLEHVALTDERIGSVHLICDGTHVHPILVRLVERCRGVEGLCLVTDAVSQAGCPDGAFTSYDGRTFTKKDGVGRTDTGGLCGSGLLLPDHLRNFIRFTGVAPYEAIRTVTLNPAASLGLDHEMGILAPGRVADLVAWDDAMRVRRIWRAGRELDGVSDHADVVYDPSPHAEQP